MHGRGKVIFDYPENAFCWFLFCVCALSIFGFKPVEKGNTSSDRGQFAATPPPPVSSHCS